MTHPIAFFDIGATFAFGPDQGPATRISTEIGLDSTQKRRLEAALMTRSWEQPESVVDYLRTEFLVRVSQAEAAVNSVWSAQENEAIPIDGAQAALNKLAEAGVRIGIISNIWHPFLIAVRKHFGEFVDKYVLPENQIYSYRDGIAKPSEILFRRALAAANVDPHQAVMVGDSYREDIEPAARLGLNTIWLLHRPAKEASNVARALNGDVLCPSHSLVSIAELEPQLIRLILSGRSANMMRPPAKWA